MSTLVVYGHPNDGDIASRNTTYLTARSGGTLTVSTISTSASVGQNFSSPNYDCYESFLAWDTTGLYGLTITACVASLWLIQDSSTQDFVCRMRLDNWGADVTSADWVAGASFPGSFTLLAHIDSNGIGAAAAYKDFIDDAMVANLNLNDLTRVVLTSDRFEAASVPVGAELVRWSTADNGGTTQDPYLTVTYTPDIVAVPLLGPRRQPSRVC